MRIWHMMRTQALEARRNPMLAMLPVLVIGMALLYGAMAKTEIDTLYAAGSSLIMCCYMVGFQFPSSAMAEEREKRTLEALLLTPVRPLEIIAARAVVTLGLCIATGVICLVVLSAKPADNGVLWLGFLLTLAFSITMGTTVGLFSPDQKTAGIVGAPVLIIGMLGTIVPWESTWPAFWRDQAWLPTRPAYELLRSGLTGESFPLARNTLVILGWVALMVVMGVRAMRRLSAAR